MGNKRLMAGALAGFLMFGGIETTWADPPADTGNAGTPAAAASHGADRSLLGMIAPVLTARAQHATQKTCKPDTLYSQHDVVGDSDGCFINRFDARDAAGVNGIPGVY
jgi:hypothetical protein